MLYLKRQYFNVLTTKLLVHIMRTVVTEDTCKMLLHTYPSGEELRHQTTHMLQEVLV